MEIKIEEHTCAMHGCGLAFWVSEGYGGRRRGDHLVFFCPNGHELIYKGESDATKLARIERQKNAEIARLEKELRSAMRKKRK